MGGHDGHISINSMPKTNIWTNSKCWCSEIAGVWLLLCHLIIRVLILESLNPNRYRNHQHTNKCPHWFVCILFNFRNFRFIITKPKPMPNTKCNTNTSPAPHCYSIGTDGCVYKRCAITTEQFPGHRYRRDRSHIAMVEADAFQREYRTLRALLVWHIRQSDPSQVSSRVPVYYNPNPNTDPSILCLCSDGFPTRRHTL